MRDVYGKRQMAKMKLLPSRFSCVYSRVKLFVFAMNSRRRYSIFVWFIYGLEEKNSKSDVTFAVCRLPLTSCLTSLLRKYVYFTSPWGFSDIRTDSVVFCSSESVF